MSAKKRTVAERFHERYEVRDCGYETPCWVWTAGHDSDGYGRFKPSVAVGTLPAHRVAYELLIGPIPAGLHIDHLCRNRACVNPNHLEPVTCRVNLMRGETHAAKAAAQTHCIHGHEFTPENTYLKPPNDARACRECLSRRRREFNARQNEAKRLEAKRLLVEGEARGMSDDQTTCHEWAMRDLADLSMDPDSLERDAEGNA